MGDPNILYIPTSLNLDRLRFLLPPDSVERYLARHYYYRCVDTGRELTGKERPWLSRSEADLYLQRNSTGRALVPRVPHLCARGGFPRTSSICGFG